MSIGVQFDVHEKVSLYPQQTQLFVCPDSSPHILVLDEPTNHLGKIPSINRALSSSSSRSDMETIEALAEAIKKYQGGIVLVSHDELLIKRVCTEAWLCRNGSVTALEYGFEQYRKLIESELQY